jgi:desulfoferrodoxin (superoxide reductase-like protein)
VSEHPFTEGDRVEVDHKTISGPHVEIEVRTGTVAQVSSTQPHITWVDWDGGPRWQLMGTAHLRHATEREADDA